VTAVTADLFDGQLGGRLDQGWQLHGVLLDWDERFSPI